MHGDKKSIGRMIVDLDEVLLSGRLEQLKRSKLETIRCELIEMRDNDANYRINVATFSLQIASFVARVADLLDRHHH